MAAEKRFRKILGYQQLWMLKAHLEHEENAISRRRSDGVMAAEKRFRKILGYKQLWMLKAHLEHEENATAKRAG